MLHAPTSTLEVRGFRVHWYYSQRLSKLRAADDGDRNAPPPSNPELESINEDVATQFFSLQQEHPGFCTEYLSFVLATGDNCPNIGTVSTRIAECFNVLIDLRYSSQGSRHRLRMISLTNSLIVWMHLDLR